MSLPLHCRVTGRLSALLIAASLLNGAGAQEPGIEDPPVPAGAPGRITLFAEHPDIVTPTGIAVDPGGRVYVLENNTHFRPDEYQGPEHDRILLFEDTDGDGVSDKRRVFHEGLTFGTDLSFFAGNGSLYASTRSQILQLRDTDGDDRADEVQRIINLETEGDYPHNGISGICFDASGLLYFGLGENLGAPYTLVGTTGDGTAAPRLSGGGEGGSIYRCQRTGRDLERIATGVWNPFGMGFGSDGSLFATDNDPSSSPPCRLLHVVEGCDFGYEYRYGRSGLHPLVTWTGEFPGTVPMVCGTGEAPCGIVAFGPQTLLIASWADHRIDRYSLQPEGASFSATRSEFIRGGNEFRPVDLAVAADGALFFSDWVSSSYALHGMGRIWRFQPDPPAPLLAPQPSEFHPQLKRAHEILKLKEPQDVRALLLHLEESDPYIRSASITALSRMPETLLADPVLPLIDDPRGRACVLIALKKSGRPEAIDKIPEFLADPSEEVRFCAIKWVADEKLTKFRPLVERELTRPDLSVRHFLAVMAALDRIDGANPSDIPAPEKLYEIVADEGVSTILRTFALRLLPPSFKKLKLETLAEFARGDYPDALRLEAIRSLQSHPDQQRVAVLAEVASDSRRPDTHRAEAIVGLASAAELPVNLLKTIAAGDEGSLRDDALRALIGAPDLEIDGGREVEAKPLPTELDAWETLLGTGDGDPDAGRRIFFHPKVGTCFRCHQMDGRGVRVGPDLTSIWKRADRRWLLESILQPNAMVAPQFLPWEIRTRDGGILLGLPLRKGGTKETYLGLDGNEFTVLKPDIAGHRELQASLMPGGLLEQMTFEEVRDLFAYLLAER